MSIINNSYIVGVNGRNLVLNTLGRLYVKVRDRYYEIDFKKLIDSGEIKNENSNLIIEESKINVDTYEYPGDGKLIISLDGGFYITRNNEIKEIISSQSTNPTTQIESIQTIQSVQNPTVNNITNLSELEIDNEPISKNIYNTYGIGNKTYKGSESNIYDSDLDLEITYSELRCKWISFLYDCDYLPDIMTKDNWIDVFLNENMEIRNFSDFSVINEANNKIKEDITKYSFVYENLPIEDSNFIGPFCWYKIDNVTSYKIFVPGDIVTDENENFKAKVLSVTTDSIYVKMEKDSYYKSNKLIKCNTNHRECVTVSDFLITDYTDKDFIYLTANSSGNIDIKSGTLIKSQNEITITININFISKVITLDSNSLYMIYLENKSIQHIKLS